MKFTGMLDINRSRDKVIEIFMDSDKLKDWQELWI